MGYARAERPLAEGGKLVYDEHWIFRLIQFPDRDFSY